MELDSKAAVDVINNTLEREDGLGTLVMDCKFLGLKITHIKFTYILQEGNKCIDFLANLGQMGTWGTTFLEDPTNRILDLLDVDTRGARHPQNCLVEVLVSRFFIKKNK